MLLYAMNGSLGESPYNNRQERLSWSCVEQNLCGQAVWPLKQAQCCHAQSKAIWLHSLAPLSWQYGMNDYILYILSH